MIHIQDSTRIIEVLQEFCKDSLDQEIRDVPKWAKRYIYFKTSMGLILEEMKGFLLYFEAKKHLLLTEIVVKPEFRGTGVGSKLIEEFKEIAKRLNKERIRWYCNITNNAANQFYRRLGFEPMGRREKKDRTEYIYEVTL